VLREWLLVRPHSRPGTAAAVAPVTGTPDPDDGTDD